MRRFTGAKYFVDNGFVYHCQIRLDIFGKHRLDPESESLLADWGADLAERFPRENAY